VTAEPVQAWVTPLNTPMWNIIRFNEHPPVSFCYFLSFHHSSTSKKLLTGSAEVLVVPSFWKCEVGVRKKMFWPPPCLLWLIGGGGVFADCLLRVQSWRHHIKLVGSIRVSILLAIGRSGRVRLEIWQVGSGHKNGSMDISVIVT